MGNSFENNKIVLFQAQDKLSCYCYHFCQVVLNQSGVHPGQEFYKYVKKHGETDCLNNKNVMVHVHYTSSHGDNHLCNFCIKIRTKIVYWKIIKSQ